MAEADGDVIDLSHLDRQTMGDVSLQVEVLKLFAQQIQGKAEGLDAGRSDLRDFAHSIKGAARGIGALRVARAAEALEQCEGDAAALIEALKQEMRLAVVEVETILAARGAGV
ncbi:Hpt domain-containing protein [Cohaesibacter sp. ES.047]|uniref:Hpt domain-containing protein n=1 Tax=Cohaesibacter sp. ES.047 TaxID=1798205 RepID=UPI000BB7115C|nr:Hpt domain-containing protein [Cohaesibacter sp. ES.047]SNY94301.1 Hpt domain-containing protein [Cohaesibacter sp. ES.047]